MGQRGLKRATDVEYYTRALGAEFVFAVERFETPVAIVRLAPEAPGLLLAEHLEGEQATAGRSAVASRCHTESVLS